MTISQIEYVLGELGYSADEWSGFDGVSSFGMSQDTNILVDFRTNRYKFNTDTEMLEISYGSLIETVYTSQHGETSDFTVDSFVPFSNIISLITSTFPTWSGTQLPRYFNTTNKL
jgi:hypothetical protein